MKPTPGLFTDHCPRAPEHPDARNTQQRLVGPIMEMESASITKTGSALGGWAGCEVIGAYANAARHAAKNAESDRARSMAWPSLARTSRPGVRAW